MDNYKLPRWREFVECWSYINDGVDIANLYYSIGFYLWSYVWLCYALLLISKMYVNSEHCIRDSTLFKTMRVGMDERT